MIFKSKSFSMLIGALALMLTQNAQAKEYRLGLVTPPAHQWTKTAMQAAEKIKEATEGRVEILVFPSGQLGNESQMLQQLQTGAMDFGFFTLGEFANRNDNYGIFLAPYIAKDVSSAQKLLKGKTAQKLLNEMTQFGVIGLGYGMAGMRQIITSNNVETVADLKGKKIRTVPFAPELAFWQSIGAAPTPMPLPALYDAFSNGQIDGMQIDFEGTWNSKYYTYAKTIINSNHMLFPMVIVSSAKKWPEMAEADRIIVSKIMAEQSEQLVAMYDEIDSKYLTLLKDTNTKIIDVDKEWFGSAIDDWYIEWRIKAPLLVELEAEAKGL